MSEPCPVGVLAFGLAPMFEPGAVVPRGRCPGLSFDAEGHAVCGVYDDPAGVHSDVWRALGAVSDADKRRAMGFGVGCCMLARVRRASDGRWLNFSGLNDRNKRAIVARLGGGCA